MEDSLNAPERTLEAVVAHLESWRPQPLALARAWSIAALVMVAPYLPFLTLMHSVFVDEIHIAEYGRLFLDPHTSWSIFWRGDHGTTPWYFIGSTFAELASRATSPSCFGGRLFGLFGSVIASGTLVAWLWRRGTLPAAALLFGLLFLFNPLLMMAYTAGRIDGWMLACAFGAGYLITASATSRQPFRLFAAGCLISFGFFVWPSVALLLPLLALELVRANRICSRPLLRSLVFTGMGASLTFLALGSVVLVRVPTVLSDMPQQLAVAGMAPSWTIEKLLHDARTIFAQLVLRSPWNVPFAFLVWRSGVSRAPLAWMSVPIAVMFATLLYGNRLIYIVPYLLIAFAGIFALPERPLERARGPSPAAWWLLMGAILVAYLFAVVVRPVLPWQHRATRAEGVLLSAAEGVAARSASVCLDGSAVEFYLVGRSKDWRMYMLTPETLALCDSVIVRPDEPAEIFTRLEAAGFRREKTLLPNQVNDAPVWEQHVYGHFVYGPYDVYRRRGLTP